MSLEDKVVILTGASSGIGAVTAEFFGRRSAKVVLVGRNEERLNEVAKIVESCRHVKPLPIKADVTNDEDVKRIIDTTIEKFGKIDILVNNAGAGLPSDLKDGIEPFDKLIALNLRSAFLLTSLAAPHLKKTKGNVVNVSSIAGIKEFPGFAGYCIAKAGLDMMTKCAAKELAADGVRVNSVNPGPVKTNFQTNTGLSGDALDSFMQGMVDRSPLGYISTSENVAEVIMFLVSDKAKSVTGSTYVVDNGALIY